MSSTNKTENLGLNAWLGSDIPSRTDFVYDNAVIDEAISAHNGNSDIHITDGERDKWNTPYYIGSYMGDNASSRNIMFNTGFVPKWGILFAVQTFPSINDFTNKANYNYFAVLSAKGSTAGATLESNRITVVNSTVPISGNGYRRFNESGVTYVYILFR